MSPGGPAVAPPLGAGRPVRWASARRLALGLGLVMALLAGAVWWGESRAWQWLAGPTERWLAQRLGRSVSLSGPAGFRLTLLGQPQLSLSHATLGNATWGRPLPMLDIDGLQLQWRWADLWRAYAQQQPLRIKSLVVQHLAMQLERGADGRANWQDIGAPADLENAAQNTARPNVRFDRLQLGQSSAELHDAMQQLELQAQLSVQASGQDQTPGATAPAAAAAASRPTIPATSARTSLPTTPGLPAGGLQLSATGSYRKLPVSASLRTGAALPLGTADSAAGTGMPVQLELHATVGRARLDFSGQVQDPLATQDLRGHYSVSGPSLAAVGEPLHLTLPATRAFAMTGRLVRQGTRWFTVVDKATVGSSRLAGEFTFDNHPGGRPLLAGRLRGAALLLQDLGPALGLPTEPGAPDPRRAGRVLPDRRFDLPALRAMDANILIKLDRLDPGTKVLQPVAPLQAHLLLQDGVLDLRDIDAHLAQGRLRGHIQLDGRNAIARWQAQLAGSGLDLARWVTPLQRPGGPPWASGRLSARLNLQGQGRSSAELLAGANGRLLLYLAKGSISHLAVEAAGLDIAQGLGLLLRGDDNLPVTCGAGDLLIKNGLVTPQVLMLDNRDSTIWVAGSVSLATEQLALTANVAPKDWSPMTLRAPLHLDGSLAHPVLSLDKPALLKRLVPAALLALVNPLAGLLPLVDLGGPADGVAGISACRDAAARQLRGRAAKL